MLQTPRLHLRNLCPADADLLFDYRNDRSCNLYQRYDDTSMAYLQKFIQDYSHNTFLSREEEQHYAIVCTKESKMIGDVSVFFRSRQLLYPGNYGSTFFSKTGIRL